MRPQSTASTTDPAPATTSRLPPMPGIGRWTGWRNTWPEGRRCDRAHGLDQRRESTRTLPVITHRPRHSGIYVRQELLRGRERDTALHVSCTSTSSSQPSRSSTRTPPRASPSTLMTSASTGRGLLAGDGRRLSRASALNIEANRATAAIAARFHRRGRPLRARAVQAPTKSWARSASKPALSSAVGCLADTRPDSARYDRRTCSTQQLCPLAEATRLSGPVAVGIEKRCTQDLDHVLPGGTARVEGPLAWWHRWQQRLRPCRTSTEARRVASTDRDRGPQLLGAAQPRRSRAAGLGGA